MLSQAALLVGVQQMCFVVSSPLWGVEGHWGQLDLPVGIFTLETKHIHAANICWPLGHCAQPHPHHSHPPPCVKVGEEGKDVNLEQILPDLDQCIYCYCSVGYRSSRLAERLCKVCGLLSAVVGNNKANVQLQKWSAMTCPEGRTSAFLRFGPAGARSSMVMMMRGTRLVVIAISISLNSPLRSPRALSAVLWVYETLGLELSCPSAEVSDFEGYRHHRRVKRVLR